MEHWDHRACEGLEAVGSRAAAIMTGIIGVCLFCAIGFGLL